MVKKRLILQLQQKEIAALEEIIQTYHNYVAKIVYSILSFYSTEIDIQAVINQVFFCFGKRQNRKIQINVKTLSTIWLRLPNMR